MDFVPVAGDTAGNNLKWDSMKIEADMYLKTGNYSLLRDVRMRQARFTELEEMSVSPYPITAWRFMRT